MQDENDVKEVMHRIEGEHLRNKEVPIPAFISLYKRVLKDLFIGPEDCRETLELLVECNYLRKVIFTESDSDTKTSEISGYVSASLPIIRDLKAQFHKKLEIQYEYDKKMRLDANSIIKFLMSNIKNYDNTPLGKMLGISLVLNQCESDIYQNYGGCFDENHRRTRLQSKLSKKQPKKEEVGITLEIIEPNQKTRAPEKSDSARAMDNPEHKRLQEEPLKGSWGRAVSQFSVLILLRIHFRKCEFAVVLKLLNEQKIRSGRDIQFIYDTLSLMMNRIDEDIQLQQHITIIRKLREKAYSLISSTA